MGKVVIDESFCKGCGICVSVCPQSILKLDTETITPKGYNPAMCINEQACTGCASCALMCPDVAISVYREVRA
ncbi:4Fe-4S binding protein [Adlercreutzia sp. ZJ304]|uniref:indolepyruvate ferredoxin oxidoreductase subunit alpha n=1 Tax=Adlercreutzia sp. ZJ304 TaxID=2709791 RepID=UPI0013ED1576|nr:4Fe-4S binding protein [Adlercreutzia sp. ZJ304]